jgi:leucyl aminopeptidase
MEEEERPFESSFSDQLIPSNVNFNVSQNFIHEEEDDIYRATIEESIRLFQEQSMKNKQIEECEKKRLKEEEDRKLIDIKRSEERKAKFKPIFIKLNRFFKGDDIANDIINIIEWECTPTYLLTSFRPQTKNSRKEIDAWIKKNINPADRALLEEISYFI